MNPSRFRLPRGPASRSFLLAAGAAVVLSPREQEKLPIYSQAESDIVLQEVPSELERQIGVARRHLFATYRETHSQVQGVVSKWIGVEHAVENRVKAIISPEESLTPGVLYVGVATLTGSIITRSRALPIRLFFPPALFALSLNHFLPKTTENLTEYFGSLERTYLPTFAEKHAIARAHSAMTWERIKEATASGRERLNRGVESGVEKVQDATGLKLKETLGWGKDVSKQVEGRVAEVVHAAEVKVGEAKAVAEKKAEEVKGVIEKKAEEVKVAAEKKVDEVLPPVEKKAEEVKRLV
ncbi:hypothetical protein PM082_021189 [Marasmius tenuissimus]|nr:hypothetical protein PM082_021189 [Marasmius tenuissimus]